MDPTPERMRLVLTQEGSPPAVASRAWLYPHDATAFSPAVASFALADTQELPRLAPGGLVEVAGRLAPGSTGVEVRAGGVVLRPAGPLDGDRRLGFAEARGSQPLVHPALAASLGPYARTWIERDGVTKAGWEPQRWAGQYRREVVVGGVALALLLALLAVALATDADVSVPPVVWFGGGGPGLVALVRARRRRRRVRAAAEALRGRVQRPTEVRLWWSPSPDGGAGAWVTLFEPGAARPLASQPVVGVPAGWEPPDGAPALVDGEPRAGEVVVVRVGDVVLHPSGTCRTDVAPARAPSPPTVR